MITRLDWLSRGVNEVMTRALPPRAEVEDKFWRYMSTTRVSTPFSVMAQPMGTPEHLAFS